MSPKLKPLILPQLVEERRKFEELQIALEGEVNYVYLADNASSSSDVTSPVTPTFSQRGGGHLRYSSSASSLELVPPPPLSVPLPPPPPPPPTSSCSESPASPTQLAHANNTPGKRPLPDVQEDPLEREDEELTVLPNHLGLYDCLCDEPCAHGDFDTIHSAIERPDPYDIDYDLGSISDSDLNASPRSMKKRRSGPDSPFSGLTSRFGLSRWRSGSVRRRANSTFTPASDPALDHRTSFSHAPSSRSSSLSAPGRQVPDRVYEPALPPTPALSFYGSTESIALPTTTALDIEQEEVRKSLERERALAATPLLPPLLTGPPPPSRPHSVQHSPLQSPTIAPPLPQSPIEAASPAQLFPSPPLSTKLSISSFRPTAAGPSLSAPPSTCASEIPSPIPNLNLLEHYDAWSDRLGHANYTIMPKPYVPELPSLEALQRLRAEWGQARINYTKHLARTGEHYGTTSKTYALTEAKWAETDREWRAAHETVIEQIVAAGINDELGETSWFRLQDDVPPATVPRMLDSEGKFPALGDEDIVGPMVRDAVMVRESWTAEEKHGASKFFKSLADKMKLRK